MAGELRSAVPAAAPDPGARRWLAASGVVLLALAGSLAAGLWTPGRLLPPPRERVLVLNTAAVPVAGALPRAAAILRHRLISVGYAHPAVSVTGPRTVTVRVAAEPEDLRQLVAPGRVSFRAVRAGPALPDPPPEANEQDDGGPPAPDLPSLAAKLGPAYPLAQRISDPAGVDADTSTALATFGALTPAEVTLLPATMQYAVPAIGCDRLTGPDDPGAPLAACQPGAGKYLLDPAGAGQTDIAGVSVLLDAATGWAARVRFTPAGQARWSALTEAVLDGPTTGHLAVVLDREVLAAPRILQVGTGDELITVPGMDQHRAACLAALLAWGPLPVEFTTDN